MLLADAATIHFKAGLCSSFLAVIRQICSPTNVDERPLERLIIPGWSANELPRRVGLRRSSHGYATRDALGA